MSKPSKNIPAPISSMMRRWKLEMGRRSRRAPESAVTASSLLPREQGQAAFRQSVNCMTAVLVEEVLLGVEKKVLAAAYSRRVEPQDALNESVGFGREAIRRTDLRDQTYLLRAMRVDGLTEQNEGKCEMRKGVFTQVGHDGSGGRAGALFCNSGRWAHRTERGEMRNAEGCIHPSRP